MNQQRSAKIETSGKKKPEFTPPPQNQDKSKTIVIKLPPEIHEIKVTCEFV